MTSQPTSTTSTDVIPATLDAGTLTATSELTPAEMDQARTIAHGLDVTDSMAVISFGSKAQKEIDSFSDTVLERVKTRDAGETGEALTKMLEEVRGLNADAFIDRARSFVARLPVVGKWYVSINGFISSYESVGAKIDKLIVELDRSRTRLGQDIAMLDGLYDQNAT